MVGELPALVTGRRRADVGDGAMTLLRRAPREVYRVYGEDEFLAAAAPADEPVAAGHPRDGGWQLQRLVGATLLLVIVGVVGGMVAITGVWSQTGDRRRGAGRMLAARRPPVPVRGVSAQVHVGPAARSRLGQSAGRRGFAPHVAGRASHVASKRVAIAASSHAVGSRRRDAGTQVENVSGSTPVVQTANAGPGVSVADAWAGAKAEAPRPVQTEFGFERR